MRAPSTGLTATIGDVSESQIAVGEHIIQVNARDGAIVNLAPRARRPRPKLRPLPLQIRPRPLPGFLDRVEQTAAAGAGVALGELVQIVGAAGIGKTALLRRLAYEPLGTAFPDGILCLNVSGRSGDDVLQLVYAHMYDVPGRYRPNDGELRAAFSDRRALIVLDDVDCPHQELEAVLDALPGCVLVLATEERRAWAESRVIPLPGLPVEDAVALYERELGRSLEPAERTQVAARCSELGGQPLKVLQLAAGTREAALAAGAPALAREPEQGSEQRALLLVLAAVGSPLLPVHLSELSGVADADRAVAPLLTRRLVSAVDGRYQLVPGTPPPAKEAELEAVRRRALEYFAAWAAKQQPEAIGPERGALLALLRWAGAAGQFGAALRLGRAIEPALMLSGMWGAWRTAIEACRAAARGLPDQAAVESWALHQLGTLAFGRGDAAQAVAHWQQALRLRESAGDVSGAEATRHNLRVLEVPPGPLETAREWVQHHTGGALAAGLGTVVIGAGLVWYFGFYTPVPTIAADPGEVGFDAMEIGLLSAPRQVTIRNDSRVPSPLGGARIDGAPDFQIVANDCPEVLAAGGSCTVAAAFAPSLAGLRTARLQLSDAQGRAVLLVGLSGYGQARRDSPQDSQPVGSDVVRIGTQDVDFGEREVGSVLVGRGTLRNEGTVAVRLGDLGLDGDADFRLLEDRCSGASLEPGGGCVVEIEFTPAAPGTRAARIPVLSSNGDEVSILHVRGAGLARGALAPPPRILHLSLDSSRLRSRRELRLCYGVADAQRVRIAPGPGDVPAVADRCVPIRAASARYTLQAVGTADQSVSRELSVEIPGPRIGEFSARPQAITEGTTSQLCYVLANVFAAEITPEVGAVKPVASACVSVRPATSTRYVLAVEGFDGSRDRRMAAVRVSAAQAPPPPRILQLSLDSSELRSRRELQLCYGVADARLARIEPGPGDVPAVEKACVPIRTASARYTLQAVGEADQSVSREISVEIPGPRIDEFSARPQAITEGKTSQLCYALANVFAAEITPEVGTVKPVASACVSVRPAQSTRYVLAVEGFDGSRDRRTAAVRVSAAQAPPPPRILQLSLDSSDLRSRRELQLCYGVADARLARIEPGPGDVPAVEKACVPIRTASARYTLQAVGEADQSVSREISVEIPGPRIDEFVARPQEITAGDTVQLCYVLGEVFAAEITPRVGVVKPVSKACVPVRPATSTTYVLAVEGFDGSRDQRTAEVKVSADRRAIVGGRALDQRVLPGDREPPPTPRLAAPGVPAGTPPPIIGCSVVVGTWSEVSDPSSPVTYDVQVQRPSAAGSWDEVRRSSTNATRLDLRPLVLDLRSVAPTTENPVPYRWTVSARDAAGNRSRAAPWYYFQCGNIR